MVSEKRQLIGIHHITAIAGDPQRNIDFYTEVMGLRMVKLTVNFDDPSAYHLYYGDEEANPGSILTFFSWPGAQKGWRGTGQAVAYSFSIPEQATGYWLERFKRHNVEHQPVKSRFSEDVITFLDPDGLMLELVAHAGAERRSGWFRGSIPEKHALRGFYSTTLSELNLEPTRKHLVEQLRFRHSGESQETVRFETGPGGAGTIVDVQKANQKDAGLIAVGTIHHVALRTPDDVEHVAWRRELFSGGVHVTPVIDRYYFHSIYFREPGNVLFEIATDQPGFTIDESREELGSRLRLPPWLEKKREIIEQNLPSVGLASQRTVSR
jgi:catechol 2,3-dioxygenase-like lactoylglutathione lyase family enzyme